mgnify:CR=1 FL=1
MTISIQGAPRKFEQAELDRREAAWRSMYHTTLHCKELVRGEIPYLFLQAVSKKTEEGYILDGILPIRIEAMNYSAYMIKPQDVQDREIEQLIGKVKDDYVIELQAELEEYKKLLKAQLLESDALKEQKKLDIAKSKRLAEIEAEVENCFGELQIPE